MPDESTILRFHYRLDKHKPADASYRGLKKNTLQLKGAVCAAKPSDGPAPIDGGAGLSASESSQTALNRIKMSKCHLKNGAEKPDQKASCLI